MTDKLTLNTVVSYGSVDRDEVLTLAGGFRLLQDAAIAHANQFDTGTCAMLSRGESWVLNRMAVAIARYPRHGEAVRIETWSSGIRGFKGYRDFCGYDDGGESWLRASSVWLYVNRRTKAIVRVPREVAQGFPTRGTEVFCPELESLEFAEPAAETRCAVTLRYGDFDANGHVNHTAYLDFLQTALAGAGRPARPGRVQIKFLKGIPGKTAQAEVWLKPRGEATGFAVAAGDGVAAVGEVA